MTRHPDERRGEEARLREFFRAAHATDRVPPFARLVRASEPVTGSSRWRPVMAALAVVVVAVAVGWLMPRLAGTRSAALTEEEHLALASELSSPDSWKGPLDFLLETPSREILFAPPSFELTTLTIPPPAGIEEIEP